MISTSPTEVKNRETIVDIVRGLAIVGVLFANFTSYINQQTPDAILSANSSSLDNILMNINAIFFEWKFMTLFSILFGYGFGLILESLKKKNIDPNAFFLRRMFWLFIFGCIHSLFWWADVLHLYALSGILLLLFRKISTRSLLICSFLFMVLVPLIISYIFRNQPETFTDNDVQDLYYTYKHGNIANVFSFNTRFYYKMFVISGSDLHDLFETLGRFLLGYFLLRIKFFQEIQSKKLFFKKILLFSLPVTLGYFFIRWQLISDTIKLNQFVRSLILSIGIFSTTTFYVSLLVILFLKTGMNYFFNTLQALGRMTLTNYLLISTFLIILLYGFGFNKLGEVSVHAIWLYALGWLIFEVAFSSYWLKNFRYGPLEWIWRQLTYRKRLPLRK